MTQSTPLLPIPTFPVQPCIPELDTASIFMQHVNTATIDSAMIRTLYTQLYHTSYLTATTRYITSMLEMQQVYRRYLSQGHVPLYLHHSQKVESVLVHPVKHEGEYSSLFEHESVL